MTPANDIGKYHDNLHEKTFFASNNYSISLHPLLMLINAFTLLVIHSLMF